MIRKILWVTNCWEALGPAYERAEADAEITPMMEALEALALQELGEQCAIGRVKKNGQKLTQEWLDAASDEDREGLLHALGASVLRDYHVDLFPPKVTVTLSPLFPQLVGCAAFALIDKLERLDGAIQIVAGEEQVEMEMLMPDADKPDLPAVEALLRKLYPWLTITDSSSGQKGAAPMKRN